MSRRIVLAAPEPQYAAKLARYLKESNPDWEIAAYTQEAALSRRIRESPGAEALIVHSSMLSAARGQAEAAGYRGKLIALSDEAGSADADGLAEVRPYQPLSSLCAELRELLGGGMTGAGGARGREGRSGTAVWTVFSASGGTGKTTVALNMVRQACERGYRTCYLNLEPLNATDLLFGAGEPDSLSRLLYSLNTRPEQGAEEWERLRRRHSWLQADYLDAPDMPAERLAMTPERLRSLLDAVIGSGSYDLVVVDPDSGCGDWHRELLAASGRIVWLMPDDALALRKADKLVRYWQDQLPGFPGNVDFVVNKHAGGEGRGWSPSPAVKAPAAQLPYIPQWKAMEQPGGLFQSPAFSGAIDRLLDGFGLEAERRPAERRGGTHGRERDRAHAGRTG